VPERLQVGPDGHPVRNYLIFATLTLGAIGAGALLFAKRTSTGAVHESCSMTGKLVALPEVSEASGLALSRGNPGVLWTHDDQQPVLFAIDVLGKLKGRVTVTDAPVQDWEDVAVGPCEGKTCLFIADIGDNRGQRDQITVYRVPEPSTTDKATAPAEAFHATYPDGPQDAEALFVSKEGGLYIVTKGNNGPIVLYRFPEPLRAGTSVSLERVLTLLATNAVRSDRVTGAGTSPDGKWIVLRTHDAVLFYEAGPLLKGSPSRPHRYDVRWLKESQAEGVALGAEGALYLVSEGGGKDMPGLLAHGICTVPTGGV
jgi:hypothetical protein